MRYVVAGTWQIHELQRKIVEVESKAKQQQQLYESVRSDRNNYSKSLIEAQVSRRAGTTPGHVVCRPASAEV